MGLTHKDLTRLFRIALCCIIPGITLAAADPPNPPFRPDKLRELDAAIETAIREGACPGAVLWLEHDSARQVKAYGRRAIVPSPEMMTTDTIFDAASLTKVIATAPSVLLLIERNQLNLDDPVSRYIPEFTGEGRELITVRHLLTHTSGLRPGIPLGAAWSGYEQGQRLAREERPTASPGTAFRYGDVNFILLAGLVQRVSGQRLDEFAAREIFAPLNMADTGFAVSNPQLKRTAPTEKLGDHVLRGTVHDPTARRMNGVGGHAGLFTTAADLARFARMMLARGELEGTRVFKPETIDLMTRVQTPDAVTVRRGLGWDIDSPFAVARGRHFPLGSYGHTGWTGTSIWIDPLSKTFLILLSNRNHPTEDGSVSALRRTVATLAAEAISDFNFTYVPGALQARTSPAGRDTQRNAGPNNSARVLNGIDVLVRDDFAPLKGRRVGLITNQTGQDRDRRSTIDLLHRAPGVQLKALFSPEHGIRGVLDDKVADGIDDRSGLPVYSLYGEFRKPRPEQLRDLDCLVFDIQDIGCRFYTYISTMGLAMQAAAEARLKFIVLDRVNPITGTLVEGPVNAGESTFTAFHSIPLRHGMTVGELAGMLNTERGFGTDLEVIRLQGWKRTLWFDETGLPWTPPSPNMRNPMAALLYPGAGLLETAVSVGRGTDIPFEWIGAPYVDESRLAKAFSELGLPGLSVVPARFTPATSVFKDQSCGGIRMMVTDREALNAVDVGMALGSVLRRLYPTNFALPKMQTLLQSEPALEALRLGRSLEEIRSTWTSELDAFKRRRERFLLYP